MLVAMTTIVVIHHFIITSPSLSPLPPSPCSLQGGKPEFRSVPVPPHRFTPLKENWMKIFTPIVEHLKLQIRLNLKSRNVEIKVGGGRERGREKEKEEGAEKLGS